MTPTRTTFIALICIIVIALFGVWYWNKDSLKSFQAVGKGEPLQQNTHIHVLEAGQPLHTTSNSTQISVSIPTTEKKSIPPAVFDKTSAQLGTTLSLLLSSWPEGGTLPRELANTASQLAEKTGQPALADAAASLRSSTPREGPTTKALLLVSAAQALTLTPPEDLPQDDASAEAQKSWIRKQLESIINIRSTPQTQNRWSSALLTVQQQIARGLVTDAMQTLSAAPLKADPRLNTLRSDTSNYLAQTGKLNRVITTYTNTYLTKVSGE